MGAAPPHLAETVRRALRRSARHTGPLTGILRDLQEGGFLIPEATDERALVHRRHLVRYSDQYLHLIILPTEQCNCRCVYCYQSFVGGSMSDSIREGIRRHVAGQTDLKRLDIHWFGGEPLVAPDVVIELSEFFAEHCAESGVRYGASMTTNASLLSPKIADRIIPLGVRHFQITLDGVREEHDRRRPFTVGGGSFDDILTNLRYLMRSDHVFNVVLRHNFDPESLPRLPELVAMLKSEFGGDPRFTTLFEPIGQWGGHNDADLSVCEWRSATQVLVRAKQLAVEAGFRSGAQVEQLGPGGFVCYAANPRSFVIGPDGRLYKCTVELDYHDRNVVGRLHPDGTMELDWRKMALWCETNGMDEGKKCGACFFSPACHGAVCPKQWMDDNDCACPHERVSIRQQLRLLHAESSLPPAPTAHDEGR